ncbi:LysE family translocator [Pseudomonas baltica]|uniref:LysE family translocator n=1 Tax=Pseudomonas baltica TaxID=2762576 RepID=A0A7X1G714_9PSED|nr:LysE family translocator [Pseudomonas baltica]MBC2678919.1 LysE family translocator [Pseudomonas baltica]
MSIVVSMAVFALASSISPGPVNLVSLSCGAHHGLRAALPHVTGATLGFILLLLLMGLGMHEVLNRWPWLTQLIRMAGVIFLLYLAYRLASSDGRLDTAHVQTRPSAFTGALMQWLNPKAWLACLAGMGAFVADGDVRMVWMFALIYLVVCWLSLASWAWAGASLRDYLNNAARLRGFNRVMAALLGGCAVYLLLE